MHLNYLALICLFQTVIGFHLLPQRGSLPITPVNKENVRSLMSKIFKRRQHNAANSAADSRIKENKVSNAGWKRPSLIKRIVRRFRRSPQRQGDGKTITKHVLNNVSTEYLERSLIFKNLEASELAQSINDLKRNQQTKSSSRAERTEAKRILKQKKSALAKLTKDAEAIKKVLKKREKDPNPDAHPHPLLDYSYIDVESPEYKKLFARKGFSAINYIPGVLNPYVDQDADDAEEYSDSDLDNALLDLDDEVDDVEQGSTVESTNTAATDHSAPGPISNSDQVITEPDYYTAAEEVTMSEIRTEPDYDTVAEAFNRAFTEPDYDTVAEAFNRASTEPDYDTVAESVKFGRSLTEPDYYTIPMPPEFDSQAKEPVDQNAENVKEEQMSNTEPIYATVLKKADRKPLIQ